MNVREVTKMQIPRIDFEASSQNIRRFMDGKGLTVIQVQRALQLTCPQTVYKWLYGQSLPSIDNLVALASLLDVKIDDIVVTR